MGTKLDLPQIKRGAAGTPGPRIVRPPTTPTPMSRGATPLPPENNNLLQVPSTPTPGSKPELSPEVCILFSAWNWIGQRDEKHNKEVFEQIILFHCIVTNTRNMVVLMVVSSILKKNRKIVCLFGVFHPLEISLIWRRHHYRCRTANFDLYLALMAIEQGGFFSVSHLLCNRPTLYNSHLWARGPAPLAHVAERLAIWIRFVRFDSVDILLCNLKAKWRFYHQTLSSEAQSKQELQSLDFCTLENIFVKPIKRSST